MKTKFDPRDVPSWCRWIAVDGDGECVAYRVKPIIIENVYFWVGGEDLTGSTFQELYMGKPPKNWKEELYTWS